MSNRMRLLVNVKHKQVRGGGGVEFVTKNCAPKHVCNFSQNNEALTFDTFHDDVNIIYNWLLIYM